MNELNFENRENVYWNLTFPELFEKVVLTNDKALRVLTGKYTGRSPNVIDI